MESLRDSIVSSQPLSPTWNSNCTTGSIKNPLKCRNYNIAGARPGWILSFCSLFGFSFPSLGHFSFLVGAPAAVPILILCRQPESAHFGWFSELTPVFIFEALGELGLYFLSLHFLFFTFCYLSQELHIVTLFVLVPPHKGSPPRK